MTVNLINPLQKAAFSAIPMTRPASGKDGPEPQALKDRRENRIIHAFHGPKREIPAATNSFLLRKETNVLPQSDGTSSAKRLLFCPEQQKEEPSGSIFPPDKPPAAGQTAIAKDSHPHVRSGTEARLMRQPCPACRQKERNPPERMSFRPLRTPEIRRNSPPPSPSEQNTRFSRTARDILTCCQKALHQR